MTTHLFAQRTQALEPSAIRKMFKYFNRPGVISFAGGWPDPALFPVEEISEIMQHIMATESDSVLQYGITAGDPRLRTWLRQRLADRYNMTVGADEIMVTTGSQQGIFLTNALLIDKDDLIVTEAPTFVGAFGGMQTFEGRFTGIEMDAEGLDMNALEDLLKREKVKYVYTIPEFQNPSGLSMTLARRKRLIELAVQYDFLILEDAPYSDLRYEGTSLPTIHSLDTNKRTIYLGSFSKTFSPMRVGWLVAPAPLIEKLTPLKQAIDVNTPNLTQAIVYHFCERGLLEKQIAMLCTAYKRKRDIMMATMDRYMPAGVEWTAPEGGMFTWVTLPDGLNAEDVFYKAVDRDVAFVYGAPFYPDQDTAPRNKARLNWVTASEDQIRAGMQTFAEVVSEMM